MLGTPKIAELRPFKFMQLMLAQQKPQHLIKIFLIVALKRTSQKKLNIPH